MMVRILSFICVGSCILLWVGCSTPERTDMLGRLPDQVDFNFHIKPLLSDRCLHCHGPDEQERKGNLRLDDPQSFFHTPGESGNLAIIPGEKNRSEVWKRIWNEDPEIQMPPPESHLSLSEYEKELIGKWIDQGAVWKEHWAFLPPQPLPVPDNIHPIDYWVQQKQQEKGLTSSPQATAETLIRRLSFHLTGLPPTPQEMEAFLTDTLPGYYERWVSQLLNTPQYGEHMAAQWMDVARYADSDGYLDDKHREVYPWRDWVIQAFNENMPYDQFLTWQIAGDLIPNAGKEARLATAFNRLHRKNSEAGIVFEEYRTEYVADQVQTLGKGVLGLTLECARCHDHKYDPISQKEYYQLFSFFNSTDEWGHATYGPEQNPGPTLLLTNREKEEQLAYLQQQIVQTEDSLADLAQRYADNQKAIATSPLIQALSRAGKSALTAHYPLDQLIPTTKGAFHSPDISRNSPPLQVTGPLHRPGKKGKGLFVQEYHQLRAGKNVGWFDRTDPFSISVYLHPDTLYPTAGLMFHCENLRLGLKGYSVHLDHNRVKFIMARTWPTNALVVQTNDSLPIRTWTQLTITYDGSSKAEGVQIYFDGKAQDLAVKRDHLYKGILYEPDIHTYGFQGLQLGHRDKHKLFRNGGLDDLKVFQKALTPLEVLYHYDPKATQEFLSQSSELTKRWVHEFSFSEEPHAHARLRDSLHQRREALNASINEVNEIMVMGDLPEPTPTFVLERGLYDAHGEEVFPVTPEVLSPWRESYSPNRLGLAQWLTDPQHPLTARVIVNRIWHMYFGEGLVSTLDDLGSQGNLPTHPELLDFLASYLVQTGWDVKALHRLIVTSATYRQASEIRPELKEIDPANTWLARGPRFRLSAEMIRDQALKVSGLMEETIGGASAYPYQPEGLWDEISNKSWRYRYQSPATGATGVYRRSLYTVWKRTSPPPSMLIFDMADRSVCTVKRSRTQTPLQALVLLNDPQYIEAARGLASRVGNEAPAHIHEQLGLLFRYVIGRSPTSEELQVMLLQYEEERRVFGTEPHKMEAYLHIGMQSVPPETAPQDLAALAVVAHSLMNTDEALMIH